MAVMEINSDKIVFSKGNLDSDAAPTAVASFDCFLQAVKDRAERGNLLPKLHYFERFFDNIIDFLELPISNDVRRKNVNDVPDGPENDAVFDKEIVEFVAQFAVVACGAFNFNFKGENDAEDSCGGYFLMLLYVILESEVAFVDALDMLLHVCGLQQIQAR